VFPGSDLLYALWDGGPSRRVLSSHLLGGGQKQHLWLLGRTQVLLLRQELPEDDCTQTSWLLKSHRWDTSAFFLSAGTLLRGGTKLEQAEAAQGSLLPVSARLAAGARSGLAPEPSPAQEPARLARAASGQDSRTGAPCQRPVQQWLGTTWRHGSCG